MGDRAIRPDTRPSPEYSNEAARRDGITTSNRHARALRAACVAHPETAANSFTAGKNFMRLFI
jgi:hypothetical protein